MKPFIVGIDKRREEKVSRVLVRPASIRPSSPCNVGFVFGPNRSDSLWIVRADGKGGFSLDVSVGPRGMGLRAHPFIGSPAFTIPRADTVHPGFYETRDLEVCMYDETEKAHAFRERYFETGLSSDD
jgi:hypothetical protein